MPEYRGISVFHGVFTWCVHPSVTARISYAAASWQELDFPTVTETFLQTLPKVLEAHGVLLELAYTIHMFTPCRWLKINQFGPPAGTLSGLDIPISCTSCHGRSGLAAQPAAKPSQQDCTGLNGQIVSQKHRNHQTIKQLDQHHSLEIDGRTRGCGGAEFPNPNPLHSSSLSILSIAQQV